MTFPTKLMRLVIGGSLYTQESWSVGVHFTSESGTTPAADLQAPTEGFLDALDQYNWHKTAKLGFIKYNELDHITGKYVNAASTNAEYISPEYAVTTGTASLVPQASTCATLGTALQRGRGHAGRIYLPMCPSMNIDGHMDPGQCGIIGNAVANWINSVALLTGDTPVVWSKIADSVTPLTHVRVGDIIDTQRRRRTSLKEVYHTATVAIA